MGARWESKARNRTGAASAKDGEAHARQDESEVDRCDHRARPRDTSQPYKVYGTISQARMEANIKLTSWTTAGEGHRRGDRKWRASERSNLQR